jgi:diketogulonate reductase-like aldo/keto reductase
MKSIGDSITLSNSVRIPQIGFGVYQSPPELCKKSCLKALECGYRHIDTAQYYGNEAEVGLAVKESKISRGDIFLTTKILTPGDNSDQDYVACNDSIQKLDPTSGYVDLLLIHSPNCGKQKRKQLWQTLERLHDEGKARSIGVSNFGISHIEELKEFAKVWPPHVNQIEVRPK